MSKRPTQIDRAIADLDAKGHAMKVEHEKQTALFKHGLEVLDACRGVLVATGLGTPTHSLTTDAHIQLATG